MLFTRCPECETTFRITAEALRKADGQVRCGRCTCVFNGYNELRRRARRRAGPAPESAPTGTPPASEAGLEQPTARPPAARKQPDGGRPSPTSSAAPPNTTVDEKDAGVGDFSFAGVIAELEASAAPEGDALGTDLPAIGLPGKNALEPAPDASTPGAKTGAGIPDAAAVVAPPSWVILDEARPQRITPRVWTIGCAAAATLLALQALHHHRSNLAVLGGVGPIVQHTYAMLGTEVAPDWNIAQYEVEVDWDAVAQPNAEGRGHLKIAARIRNEGPRALPLPHVQVQLKDRWESTIGSRVFAPSEYLTPGRTVDDVMKEGQSALAELDILDPGPQAYGFELDVCVATQNGALRCAADEVFR